MQVRCYKRPIRELPGPVIKAWAELWHAEQLQDWGRAEAEIRRIALDNRARPVRVGDSDSSIRHMAGLRAQVMRERIQKLAAPVSVRWLNEQVSGLQGKEFEVKSGTETELQGFVLRACCAAWWARHLRRLVVRMTEQAGRVAGLVSMRRQVYVTDETLKRREEQRARNKAVLEKTELESADGEIVTLWACVSASVANKAIRRGELMTRIKGCEHWGLAHGMAGIFTTHTCPSRFHATLHDGRKNPRFDAGEGSARHAQDWLCKTWARARAAMQRAGLKVFGFRIAEPHHDGCPHWHMLLWVEPGRAAELKALLRAYWLKDSGDEPGAAEHRFSAEEISQEKGGAIAYVAKYISKGLDDAGAAGEVGHVDEVSGQAELIEGGSAKRIEAWAAAAGIRQFQAIGQPPVTVWRELRRVKPEAVAGAAPEVQAAHEATNRRGDRRADWAAYMRAQGGAMCGRDYRIRLAVDKSEKPGAYGLAEVVRPVGVWDVLRPGVVVLSERKEWRPAGEWTQQARDEAREGLMGWARRAYLGSWARCLQGTAPPRTRVNNCTRQGGAAALMGAGLVGLNLKPGGESERLDRVEHPQSSGSAQSTRGGAGIVARLARLRDFGAQIRRDASGGESCG